MAISIIIIVLSTALFVYWFRYTCVLILRTRDARDYAQHVAEVNHLTFLTAQQQLADAQDNRKRASTNCMSLSTGTIASLAICFVKVHKAASR